MALPSGGPPGAGAHAAGDLGQPPRAVPKLEDVGLDGARCHLDPQVVAIPWPRAPRAKGWLRQLM